MGWAGDDTPASCETYLAQHVLQPWNIAPDRYLAFQSDAVDPQQECARVQTALDAWGTIDVCVLGLGANGHLGFNEPGEIAHPFCHVAELTEATRQHPMLTDTQADTEYGMTLGLADIARAHGVYCCWSVASTNANRCNDSCRVASRLNFPHPRCGSTPTSPAFAIEPPPLSLCNPPVPPRRFASTGCRQCSTSPNMLF